MTLHHDRQRRLMRKIRGLQRKLQRIAFLIGRLEGARARGQAAPTPPRTRKRARKGRVAP